MRICISIPVTLLLCLAITPERLQANVSVDFDGLVVNGFQEHSTFGWSFEVHAPISIERLGFFDDFLRDGPGIQHDHLVQLWTDNPSEPRLLASTWITNASAAVSSTALVGQWLMNDISPVTLAPGSYMIGANDPACVDNCDGIRFFTSASTIPEITFGNARYASPVGPAFADSAHRNDGYFGPTFLATPIGRLSPDLNLDDQVNCEDIAALYRVIADQTHDVGADFNSDGQVDNDDISGWLSLAGAENGKTYLPGDATLDGSVSGADFTLLASHFGNSVANPARGGYWCDGNFNGIGVDELFAVNGNDYTLLASNFGHVSLNSVPEPGIAIALLPAICMLGFCRRQAAVADRRTGLASLRRRMAV